MPPTRLSGAPAFLGATLILRRYAGAELPFRDSLLLKLEGLSAKDDRHPRGLYVLGGIVAQLPDLTKLIPREQ